MSSKAFISFTRVLATKRIGKLDISFGRNLTYSSKNFQQGIAENQQHSSFGHDDDSTFTNRLEFIEPAKSSPVASYRILKADGTLEQGLSLEEEDASLTPDKILELYKGMLRQNIMDKVMFSSHRQGRISFYMTSFGEEACQFGSAAAIELNDLIFAQYREAGILLQRKMPLKLLLAQCYGNNEDLGKGRQMPIHYGNRELNYVTISSPLATQIPQAAGAAYAFKRQLGNKRVVICYFGEGAASEGDAHAAMNFAATLDCPVIFFCRNNGFAISTPTKEQYRGDGIVRRALGYGMSAIRVDGNDLFAVYKATREARRVCWEESRPILIEAMTYRLGHHSTSDDSSAYRSSDEVRQKELNDNPLIRVYKYLLNERLWSEQQDKEESSLARAQVIEALNWAERRKKPTIASMFDDVYDELPANLRSQRDDLKSHLEQFNGQYPLSEYDD